MKKQTKTQADSLLRTPKPSKFGLKVRPIAMPHDSLIKAESPHIELVEPQDNAAEPTVLPTNLPTHPTAVAKNQAIAPEKDFARVPNSIKRAVESGSFPNSSLAIYLYLYSLTRGAIQPKRSIRVNKAKLLYGANLRAEKALLKNLAHLKNIGLIKITVFNGDHSGNEYEVFVPEEIEGNPPTNLPTKQPTYLPTKHTPVPTDQRLVGRLVEVVENKEKSAPLRLSFKDIDTDDDESSMRGAIEMMFEAESKRITGKGLSKSDINILKDLAELLRMELVLAAARTKSISNVPAFFIEHLRRRLLGKPSSFVEKVKTSKSAKQDNSDSAAEEYQAEPLSKEGREAVLKTMLEYIGKGQKDFVLSLERNYTSEDWDWITQQLEKK